MRTWLRISQTLCPALRTIGARARARLQLPAAAPHPFRANQRLHPLKVTLELIDTALGNVSSICIKRNFLIVDCVRRILELRRGKLEIRDAREACAVACVLTGHFYLEAPLMLERNHLGSRDDLYIAIYTNTMIKRIGIDL